MKHNPLIVLLGLGSLVCSLVWPHVADAQPVRPVVPNHLSIPLLKSLLGWWQGEGNAGDATKANNGRLHGEVAFVPGKVGRAFSLDGNDQYVKIPTIELDAGGDSSTGLTVELWIKPADVTQKRPLADGAVRRSPA